jgi:RIO kinase 1
MARKISRRKKPSKDEFQLKERFKIESEVFDRLTLLILSKAIKKGIVETVDYPVSTGKEANVFRATAPSGGNVAVKIYKIETAPFLRKMSYLEGDPRFKKIKTSGRGIVEAFARKEYKNLEICEKAGVHSPKPLYIDNHVLIMTFLGEEGLPYPTMDLVGPLHGEKDLDSILIDIKKMYRAGLVHADMSEYNIMIGPVPYLIDFGQGVILSHPNAERFLERDVAIIMRFFEKHGITRDFEKTMKWIRE